ncbi:hypothetical protein SAMN02982917_2378 [Azospirillum oryzae]|uniref:Uncharacterized protein n=1 Tax=Azospirillum oryzae TaxID=286727 RepID=A0A1X7F9Z7_9PROT|nr:hypothetical protein [Azospirillum oryzae]SMF48431.1 hypothetical protein SAMN02982917_2378 [Azospirillum oryzae]
MVRFIALIAAALLAGCTSEMPVVKVPVVERAAPPAELVAAIVPPSQAFTLPGAASVACVDPGGRDALVGYVDQLRQRVQAWEAWAAP